MEGSRFLLFLIAVILTLFVVWGIGSFINLDYAWFIHGVFNRIIAAILFFVVIISNLRALWD